MATRWHEVPLAPSLRELLSEREAEGVYYVKWYTLLVFTVPVGEALSLPHPRILGSTQMNALAPVGVANLATRRSRDNVVRWL